MQNPYHPPDSELRDEKPKTASVFLFFLAANCGVLVVPALSLAFLYYMGSISYDIVVGALLASASCSLLASILLLPFRKLRLHWAAIAGSLLTIFFCFVLAVLVEL
jgi:hypothetical protein